MRPVIETSHLTEGILRLSGPSQGQVRHARESAPARFATTSRLTAAIASRIGGYAGRTRTPFVHCTAPVNSRVGAALPPRSAAPAERPHD